MHSYQKQFALKHIACNNLQLDLAIYSLTNFFGAAESPKMESKPPTASTLFGKALSSATGRPLNTKPSMASRTGTRSRLPSHPRHAVDNSAHRVRTVASSQPGAKREPVSESLYDDLPPPADWTEEEFANHHSETIVSRL